MDETPAERVRALRVRMGSHEKLAKALGTSRQRVMAWEKGAQPKPHFRAKLAELDGGNPDDFLWPHRQKVDPVMRLAEAQEEAMALQQEVRDLLLRILAALER